MKKYYLITVVILMMASRLVGAGEGTCARCEVIREENKHKTNPYVFYEDYLKDHPEEAENLTESSRDDEEGEVASKAVQKPKVHAPR